MYCIVLCCTISDILGIRQLEKKYLLAAAIINSITMAIIPATPTIASTVTIASYYAAGNELKASTVSVNFSCIYLQYDSRDAFSYTRSSCFYQLPLVIFPNTSSTYL